jgi:LmbE family N-acetylglucosaminyl deacetylase
VSRLIEGGGTSETDWSASDRLAHLPVLDLAGCPHVLVVAPHPDDEVLGAGGALVELQALGADVAVLALTDGEASHPRASIDPSALAQRRAAESKLAMRELLGGASIERLRLPDGELAGHEDAMQEAIERRLTPGTWCLAPLREDGHPDHEAAGRAAAQACARRGARLVEYPIWMWHWGAPDDPRVPWGRAQRVPLPLAARWRKSRAISVFTSQLAPVTDEPSGAAILPPSVVDRFLRPFEVLFT